MMHDINWQAVGVIVSLLLGWSGFLVGVIKWLICRAIDSVEDRLRDATDTAKCAMDGLQQHREEYLSFLGKLPIDYYRREDMIRFETLTHAKLDALANNLRHLEFKTCRDKDQ